MDHLLYHWIYPKIGAWAGQGQKNPGYSSAKGAHRASNTGQRFNETMVEVRARRGGGLGIINPE